MPTMDPFAGAQAEGEERKKELLSAIATGGAEGKKAYEAAQQQVQQYRQGALDRAQQRAQLTGQNFGGMAEQPVIAEADRFGGYLSGQQAASQSLMDQIGASGTSYLSKIGAIAPFMQQRNQQQASDREAQIQAAIAAAEREKRDTIEAEAREFARQKELLNLRAQLDRSGGGSSSTAAAGGGNVNTMTPAQFKKSLSPTAQRILPGGKKLDNLVANIQLDTGNILNSAMPGRPAQPPMFDKSWVMQNVTMPGTDKKATASRADDVMKAPELQEAADVLPLLTELQRGEGGRINDPDASPEYAGKTMREAFNIWVDSQRGIRTMKEALKQYYGPWLDQYR